MSSKEEPEWKVKQFHQCSALMNQWSIKWNNTNYAQQWRTSEAWNETLQAMPNNDEPVKQEVEQYKPYPVLMNGGSMKWNNIINAQ